MNKPAPFSFDPTDLEFAATGGLASQLYQTLRERILSGRIEAEARLPTTRELALSLNISRTTAVRAYEQLYAEGYISARVGDGTYVSAPATEIALRPAPKKQESPPQLSQLGQRLAGLSTAFSPTGAPRAFRLGVPALDLFPTAIWARLQADFWRRATPAGISYGDAAGDPLLREMLARHLRHARGLVCEPDQIILTAGTQQAITMCAQLLLNPGELAAMENPGYPRAASAMRLAGARICGIDVDEQGLVAAQLHAQPEARLAYVTPSHQYPTGVTLSLARRLELLSWAEARGSFILEDDYDGEYRYSGTPLALLASLDRSGRVIYMGTFSKITFPGLRLGYIVAPHALAEPLIRLRLQHDRHSPAPEQAVVAQFIAQGHFRRHVARMRRASRARRDALVTAWEKHLPGGLSLPVIDAGLHCMIRLAGKRKQEQLMALALEAGIEVESLSRFCLPELPMQYGLVLGFGGVDEDSIGAAVKVLARAWRGT
ncbi:PLP-dependent aminotransferase family protein [Herbaspirillum lusitanum]|uniref:PLP-dependent aminotransferase family protein n=1 Tax=Herbaspirillum lusitanum TaxID=213312 RepID=A0ABW9A533_9BURK